MTGNFAKRLSFHPGWLALHFAIIIAGIAVLISAPFQAQTQPIEGQPSPSTISAPTTVTYISPIRTNQAKNQAAAAIPPVYQRDDTAARRSRNRAAQLLNRIVFETSRSGASKTTKQADINRLLLAAGIAPTSLPSLNQAAWRSVRTWTLKLLGEPISFAAADKSPTLTYLVNQLPPSTDRNTSLMVWYNLRTFLTPTEVVNTAATNQVRNQARNRVKNVSVTIPAGSVIVRSGDVLTPRIMEELSAVGLSSSSANWRQRAATVGFSAIVIFLMLWYLWSFHREVTGNFRLMLLLDAVILVTTVLAKFIIPGHVLIPYMFPVAAATALCGLLLPAEVGVSASVVLALLVGWVIGGSFELAAYYLLTGVTGALAVRQVNRLNDFIKAGAAIAISAGAVIGAFLLLNGGYDFAALRNYAAAAAFYGVISATLAFGGFVLFASSFGATTTLHLLELAHPDQKLLRRLMADAPGTYNHSLMLSSMTERAAQEIHANVLLARVMALYHDIGKTANPACFIENQMGAANVHDGLKPAESAEIIRAHVTHGVSMAKQGRLPAPIMAGIREHHGTMTMAYFLHRALQDDPTTDASIFTYPGPKPQTKESGLLMLADGCETAVRSSMLRTPETIRDIVNRIIDERVSTGQLSECELTLQDLDRTRIAFIEVLNGVYHPRIEYPELRPVPADGNSIGA